MGDGASCLPIPPEEEKRIVDELMEKSERNLKEGNVYYVVSNRWYGSWKIYTQNGQQYLYSKESLDSQNSNHVSSNTADRPGPIDNSDIVSSLSAVESDDLELHRTLEEGQSYVLVPQEVWEKLLSWYKGGPALPRRMIMRSDNSYSVEVYLLCLKLVDSRDNSQSVIRLSKKASVDDLYQKVCSLKGLELEKVNIWDYFNKQKSVLLARSNKTLEDELLQMDQEILLDVLDDGSSGPKLGANSRNNLSLVALEPLRLPMTIAGGPTMSNGHSVGQNIYQKSSLSSTSSSKDDAYDAYDSFSSTSKTEKGGFAGLQNLGNTCFMNSAIQCLVHTTPIVEYFLGDYTNDINTQNPLGMRGELAIAFGELLRKLWSSGRTAIAPRAFKGKLGRFAPQFSGYNQHDSQELLAFLLDGLHEDLNRVKKKPYIEMKDSDDRPDEEVAEESWRYHKARNDSIIVDVCQGQYKSTLVCPACGKISITFDPFMYLTLPLPSTVTRTMTITVFYCDGSGHPMPYTVSVPKHGSCKDLSQALGAACCLRPDESLLVAEVHENRIYRYLDNSMDLTGVKDEDYLVAYRLPNRGAGKTKLEVLHRRVERGTLDSVRGYDRKLFLTPLVMQLGDSLTGADIRMAVSRMMSPLKRTCSPCKIDNGFASRASDEPSDSNSDHSGLMNHEMLETDDEDSFTGELAFHLSLVEDTRASVIKPIQKDTIIKPGLTLKVLLDWDEKEHELYDNSYLKDLPEVHKSGFTLKKTKQEAISLFSCLDAFLREEPLGPDDMWYCPSCKEHRQASKKLDLWKLPEILVVHLKRFSYSRFFKNKLDTFVNFPVQNLDLTKYVKANDGEKYTYELYAISNHYGGLGGGHYTAYAKLVDENRWYHFDDSHVSPVSETDIRTTAAYLLFYQRVKAVDPDVQMGETSQGHIMSS
ncbi:hypothetical protein SAY86_029688 [Trapa natans]|uniref:Ubiquitin carboxyl-terminal hydrolase n=1 Tax=Trapa natans TaxID=22666 RepID=A0AAN7MEV8_TRANT|nr:hypothetical protein SAY86_029688 [Trapa natans]